MRVAATLLVGAALASSANAAPLKTGRGFAGPSLPTLRSLQAANWKQPLLVQLRRTTSVATTERALRADGARLVSRRLHIWLVSRAVSRRLLPSLIARRAVAGVEANHLFHAARALAFTDPLWPTEWWRADVGAESVASPAPSKPITVIDSGVDLSHPEWAGAHITALNAQSLSDTDEDFHGTAVTSVAAAPANGVGIVGTYPGANVRVWDAGTLTDADIIAGIESAIDHGASVINMSFGSTQYSAMIEEETLVAFGTGSVLVAAAGNEYEQGNPVEYPASLNHILTIAATGIHDRPAYFSSSSAAVDLAAPGEDIVAAIPLSFSSNGWESVSGTSFSAPIVSAAIAWVWSVRTDLDQTQMFDLMRFSAKDIWDQGFDNDTGFGLLSVPAAISDEAPSPDPQEPNDDIFMVKAKGLFAKADTPLTKPGRGSASITGRLDYTEDPDDVYRVYVPARRTVNVRIVGDDNVDLELWRLSTTTVFEKGAAMRHDLIGFSDKSGTAADTVRFRNKAARGVYIYSDAYLGRDAGNADYKLTVTTSLK